MPGPTPFVAIVNADGTPTQYFFRWLLDVRIAALTTADLEILEALADKSDPDPAHAPDGDFGSESGSDHAQADFDPAALLLAEPGAAAFDPAELRLAALLADRSDTPPAFPVTRDLIANIPTFLNAGDDGRLFYATDYCHIYRWNAAGPGWKFIEGDASGYVAIGQPSGPPNGGLWGLCDGTAYAVAQPDGTVANVTTQNLTGGAFIKGDTVAAQQAATAPTFSGGSTTGVDSGAGTIVASGTGVTVATHTHTHDAPALNPPSEVNGGLPLRIGVQFYIRR